MFEMMTILVNMFYERSLDSFGNFLISVFYWLQRCFIEGFSLDSLWNFFFPCFIDYKFIVKMFYWRSLDSLWNFFLPNHLCRIISLWSFPDVFNVVNLTLEDTAALKRNNESISETMWNINNKFVLMWKN